MLVPVSRVGSVAMAFVQVVHVVAVASRLMAATGAMLVIVMPFVGGVEARGVAFVPVALMFVVSVTFVEEVRVANVLYEGMTTATAMVVCVIRVGCVSGHEFVLSLA